MNFLPIPTKYDIATKDVSCDDFTRSLWGIHCGQSRQCQKIGYKLLPNSDLCSGVECFQKQEQRRLPCDQST